MVPTPETCSVSARLIDFELFLPAAFAKDTPLLTHSPPVRLFTDPGSINSACCPLTSSVVDRYDCVVGSGCGDGSVGDVVRCSAAVCSHGSSSKAE